MLNETQKDALWNWYRRLEVLSEAKRLIETEQWEELEEFVHMHALMPLSRWSELPEYLKNEKGEPLIPNNANPRKDLEEWQDAIEVGWRVIHAEFGIDREQVNRAIKLNEDRNWESFLKRFELRKKQKSNDQ